MAETEELFAEVHRLRNEVAEIKHTTNAQVRFNKELKEAVVDQLKRDKSLIAVFRAVDGVRSQKEIIDFLKVAGEGKSSKSTVSLKLIKLRDLDLIEPIDRARGTSSIIYHHTNFAKVINLTSLLRGVK